MMPVPAVRFANQARFHPRQFLAGLARAIEANGGTIHEHSEVAEFGRVAVERHGQRLHGHV